MGALMGWRSYFLYNQSLSLKSISLLSFIFEYCGLRVDCQCLMLYSLKAEDLFFALFEVSLMISLSSLFLITSIVLLCLNLMSLLLASTDSFSFMNIWVVFSVSSCFLSVADRQSLMLGTRSPSVFSSLDCSPSSLISSPNIGISSRTISSGNSFSSLFRDNWDCQICVCPSFWSSSVLSMIELQAVEQSLYQGIGWSRIEYLEGLTGLVAGYSQMSFRSQQLSLVEGKGISSWIVLHFLKYGKAASRATSLGILLCLVLGNSCLRLNNLSNSSITFRLSLVTTVLSIPCSTLLFTILSFSPSHSWIPLICLSCSPKSSIVVRSSISWYSFSNILTSYSSTFPPLTTFLLQLMSLSLRKRQEGCFSRDSFEMAGMEKGLGWRGSELLMRWLRARQGFTAGEYCFIIRVFYDQSDKLIYVRVDQGSGDRGIQQGRGITMGRGDQ